MFDIKAEYEHSMTQLLELAKSEPWKLYVWDQVKQIDGMDGFAGFKADFLERMKSE